MTLTLKKSGGFVVALVLAAALTAALMIAGAASHVNGSSAYLYHGKPSQGVTAGSGYLYHGKPASIFGD